MSYNITIIVMGLFSIYGMITAVNKLCSFLEKRELKRYYRNAVSKKEPTKNVMEDW